MRSPQIRLSFKVNKKTFVALKFLRRKRISISDKRSSLLAAVLGEVQQLNPLKGWSQISNSPMRRLRPSR